MMTGKKEKVMVTVCQRNKCKSVGNVNFGAVAEMVNAVLLLGKMVSLFSPDLLICDKDQTREKRESGVQFISNILQLFKLGSQCDLNTLH